MTKEEIVLWLERNFPCDVDKGFIDNVDVAEILYRFQNKLDSDRLIGEPTK